jgi:hypothetical protein
MGGWVDGWMGKTKGFIEPKGSRRRNGWFAKVVEQSSIKSKTLNGLKPKGFIKTKSLGYEKWLQGGSSGL